MEQEAFQGISSLEELISTTRQLERMFGKNILEIEVLKEAIERGQEKAHLTTVCLSLNDLSSG
ncbi:hypothetical protein [Parachlamydia sp. AcF125]|uniref:hypothetical protein n=1 Tax=Parachlamydia sp. AcF125 TaxID=2795736 RepID=UPI001BC97121|nr:hypothetical protein [Parachlamydia sp. AcF125]MBS4169055.1 hypothetical protein [Parachlamydia sp. AcF125]